jgi:prepilin-type N-terminal cleavage/methylation domain-containing protein/prepilin-type processing-associated H-X9-DG protein
MSVKHFAARRVAPRPSARRAFTLVELLVVIGIIAVLISMLLPSLSRAREQARSVKCLSNLRQIAMATMGYCNENKGSFPGQGGSGGGFNWIAWGDVPDENDPNNIAHINNSALKPYLGSAGDALKEVFRCESDDVNSRPRMSEPKLYRYSYAMSQILTRPAQYKSQPWLVPANWPSQRPIKIQQVKNSANKIMVVEEDAATLDDGVWNPFIIDTTTTPPTFYTRGATVGGPATVNTQFPNMLADRHETKRDRKFPLGRGNAAFCDGHGELISRSDAGSREYHDPLFVSGDPRSPTGN